MKNFKFCFNSNPVRNSINFAMLSGLRVKKKKALKNLFVGDDRSKE